MKVSLEQAAAFAINRHGLGGGVAFPSAAAAAAGVLGLHAQLLTSAAMSAAARVKDYDRRRFEDELYRRRTLVKAWCMRGTLHLVACDDFGLFLGAVMGRRVATHREFLLNCGLSAAEVDHLPGRLAGALAAGPATRRRLHELVPELERIPGAGWGQDVQDLCYRGLLVHAEPDGNEARFARADLWLGLTTRQADPDAATADLLRRYLAAYGPASAADFAYWAGFNAVGVALDARRRLGGLLAEVEVEGCRRPLMMLAADIDELSRLGPPPRAFPLPRFDPLFMGLKDRRRFADDEWRKRLLLPGGFIAASMWAGGRVVGTWNFTTRGDRMIVDAAAFRPLSGTERAELSAGWRSLAPALQATEVEVRFGTWQDTPKRKAKEG